MSWYSFFIGFGVGIAASVIAVLCMVLYDFIKSGAGVQ